jgi:hypothetical protein
LRSRKIPLEVQLDGYLEALAKERQVNIRMLDEERERLATQVRDLREDVERWNNLHTAERAHRDAAAEHERASSSYEQATGEVSRCSTELTHAQASRTQARSSFFIGRAGRVKRADQSIRLVGGQLKNARASAATAHARTLGARERVDELAMAILEREAVTRDLQPLLQLEEALFACQPLLQEVELELQAINAAAADDARRLVEAASALFATLTKLYTDRNLLPGMQWDTVVLDEASMAMPPLVPPPRRPAAPPL